MHDLDFTLLKKLQTINSTSGDEYLMKDFLNVTTFRNGDKIKYIEDNNVNVDSMVCITDMEFHNFPSHVDYPLLWVSTNLRAKKPPIGEITFINV